MTLIFLPIFFFLLQIIKQVYPCSIITLADLYILEKLYNIYRRNNEYRRKHTSLILKPFNDISHFFSGTITLWQNLISTRSVCLTTNLHFKRIDCQLSIEFTVTPLCMDSIVTIYRFQSVQINICSCVRKRNVRCESSM